EAGTFLQNISFEVVCFRQRLQRACWVDRSESPRVVERLQKSVLSATVFDDIADRKVATRGTGQSDLLLNDSPFPCDRKSEEPVSGFHCACRHIKTTSLIARSDQLIHLSKSFGRCGFAVISCLLPDGEVAVTRR